MTDSLMRMAGAEKNVYTLATEFAKGSYESIVCCLKGEHVKILLEKDGIKVLDLNMKRLYTPYGMKQVFRLIQFLKKEGINVVLTYHKCSDFLGFLLKIMTGVCVISNRRDMGYQLRKRHKMVYRVADLFFDRIVTVSHAVKGAIIAREYVPSKKLIPIHNGLDLSVYARNTDVENLKPTLGISPADKAVAIIATLRKIKDHKTFILAASIILKRFPNVKFLLVGDDNQERGYSFKNLKGLADELGIGEHIIYLGHRHDIPEILSIIDISVLSSLSEGFSNTILESMAAGKPVVATNVGGNPEAVVDGETGFLVPPKDPHSLATTILKLLEDENLARKIGETGRKRAESLFSLTKMVDEYECLFKNFLDGYKLQ